MKYRPDFPDQFGSLADARAWVRAFFDWYNHIHRHSALGLLSPATVHFGQAPVIQQQRQAILDQAFSTHPERFVKGTPKPPALPAQVWINQPDLLKPDPLDLSEQDAIFDIPVFPVSEAVSQASDAETTLSQRDILLPL